MSVLSRLRLAADHLQLRASLDPAAADRGVVALERVEDLAEREPVRREPARVDDDVEFLGCAAHRVDLDHAGHLAQARRDVPLERRSQLRRRVSIGAEDELVDLAQAGRERRELRRAGGRRQVRLDLAQALDDELPREPHVGAVAEHERHGREAAARRRAHLLEVRQAVEPHLDGQRHEALDLFGREARCVREHRDLRVGHVGHGVDGQPRHDERARDQDAEREHEDDRALLDGEADDSFEHLSAPDRS